MPSSTAGGRPVSDGLVAGCSDRFDTARRREQLWNLVTDTAGV
jgi:hypothetical protein